MRVSPSLADGSPKGDRRDDEDAVFRLPDKQSKAPATGHAARRSPRIALAYTGPDGSGDVAPPPGVSATIGAAVHGLLGIPSVLPVQAASCLPLPSNQATSLTPLQENAYLLAPDS